MLATVQRPRDETRDLLVCLMREYHSLFCLVTTEAEERTTMQIDEHITLASSLLPRYGWTTPWVSNKMGVGKMGLNRLDYPFHGLQSRFFEKE